MADCQLIIYYAQYIRYKLYIWVKCNYDAKEGAAYGIDAISSSKSYIPYKI